MSDNDKIKLYGYSERGAINAFLYDIYFKDNKEILIKFLKRIKFLNKKKIFEDITKHDIEEIQIFNEQSFSEFGDSDFVILLEYNKDNNDNNDNNERYCIFFEAKVSTYRNNYNLKNEWKNFSENLLDKNKKFDRYTSNLFTQLLFKYFLSEGIKNLNEFENWEQKIDNVIGIKSEKDENKDKKNDFMTIKKGNNVFAKGRDLETRKIGKNGIVLKAVKKIKEFMNDSKNYFFVGILPNTENDSNTIFSNYSDGVNKILNNPNLDFKNNIGFTSFEALYELYEDKNCLFPKTCVYNTEEDGKEKIKSQIFTDNQKLEKYKTFLKKVLEKR